MAPTATDDGVERRTAVFLSLLPPQTTQRRLAMLLASLSVGLFVVLVPFAKVPLPPEPAFLPAYQAALLVSDLVTACVLIGQYSIQQTRALLVLGTAYFFTAIAIVPHTLSFPGLLAPDGLLGSGPQTTVWLFMLWHGGFPLLVMLYAVVKQDARSITHPNAALGAALLVATLAVLGATALATAGHDLLPALLEADNTYTPAMTALVLVVWALNLVALLALWFRRPHSVLDLWMMVVMVAWTCDVGLGAALNAKRFDLGFYTGRAYGLAAAIFVLVMLLLETRGLYARLAKGLMKDRDSAARRAQRFFETSLDLILATDTYGRIIEVNGAAQWILGYEPKEMVGRIGRDFIHPEDLDATRNEMRAARRGGVIRNFRCRYLNRQGRPVSLVWTGVWSEADRRHFFIGRDMTEVEAKEEQLRQLQKMEAVGQLTGGMAHDFNNILMVILVNVEELLEDESLSPAQRDRLTNIAASGERAAELTRSLLAFSRKQRLTPRPTNLTDLIAGTDKLLRRTLGEQIEIDTIFADNLWVTSIDRAQLEAALVNLCVNARDAMPQGGRLLIETRNMELDEAYVSANPGAVPGQYVVLAVSDTGTGMPAEVQERVFEPFFTTKEVGKGTGLGLSMVYGFVKQSNGHIKIYSEVGRGTTIRLYLPRSDAPAEDEARVEASLPRGDERVLLVEDDPQVRGAVLAQLCSLGYTVTDVASGQAAIDLLKGGAGFDLVLSDLVMPGIAGPQLADEIIRRSPALKMLFMSGYSENAAIAHDRVAIGARVLSKPFRKIDLANGVREALDATDGAAP
jgi:PAS domain S-box-containing protein